jgi:hypothetical protein
MEIYKISKKDVKEYYAVDGKNGKEIAVVYELDGMKWTGEVVKVFDQELEVYCY